MNNLGIDKNINKIQTVNVTGGDAASAADAPILTESGFGRVFDGAKKRLSDQSGAAPSGNDLPMGALCIVPISPAVNVLTSIAGEISDDVIRTYARQQGLNPAVLGVILGHGFPDGGTPATQSVLAATLGLPACPSDHALTAGLRAVTPGLTVGHVAVEGVVGRLGSKLKSSAGAAGEMMAAQVLGSLGNSSVPSPDIQSENGAVNEPLLAGFPTEGGAGMRSLATTGRWRGVTGATDATGGVSQIAIDQPMQLPQQTGQIRQAALPIASIVAGQLTQSLKFERVAAQYAQAPAPPVASPDLQSGNGAVNEPLLAGFPTEGGAGMRSLAAAGRWQGVIEAAVAKDSDENPAFGISKPKSLIGMVWHEEVDLTYLMPERDRRAGADAAPAAIPVDNAGEATTREDVWRQERAQQDLSYQKLSEQMMDAVGRRITDQVAKGVWQMSFQLRPSHLGKVDVRLGVANGTIDAAFYSAQAATQQLLDIGLTRLREVLQSAGFEVGNLQTGGQGVNDQAGRRPQSDGRETGLPQAGGIARVARGIELNAKEPPRPQLAADGVDVIV